MSKTLSELRKEFFEIEFAVHPAKDGSSTKEMDEKAETYLNLFNDEIKKVFWQWFESKFKELQAQHEREIEKTKSETRINLLEKGYKHLPIGEQINMFSSVLGLLMKDMREDTNAKVVETSLEGKFGVITIKYEDKGGGE